MWNPFRAIGNAVKSAASATGNAVKSVASSIKSVVTRQPTREAAPPVAPPPAPAAPPVITPAPAAPPPGPKLPPSMFSPRGEARDERALGTDSDQERALQEAIKEFEAENDVSLLGGNARDFIDHPSFSAAFDKYITGSGFLPDQWLEGMSNVRNVRIMDLDDGSIELIFDADFEIDGYDLGTRTVKATF